MIRRPPRSTLFPYTTPLPIYRGHDVPAPLQGVHRADGGRLFPRAEPGLGEHAGAHPALELDVVRSEEHTSELQSRLHLVCRLLLEKKKKLRLSSLEDSHRVHE